MSPRVQAILARAGEYLSGKLERVLVELVGTGEWLLAAPGLEHSVGAEGRIQMNGQA